MVYIPNAGKQEQEQKIKKSALKHNTNVYL